MTINSPYDPKFADWLNIVDARAGYDWRREVSTLYSWQAAFEDGLSVVEAIADCKSWLEA